MKIKLSKSQWEKIGKTAGWMSQDPLNFSDQDVDAIYSPEEEEMAMTGKDEADDNYAYKSGYEEGLKSKENKHIGSENNPYRTDTEQGIIKFNQWMVGFKDAVAGKPPAF